MKDGSTHGVGLGVVRFVGRLLHQRVQDAHPTLVIRRARGHAGDHVRHPPRRRLPLFPALDGRPGGEALCRLEGLHLSVEENGDLERLPVAPGQRRHATGGLEIRLQGRLRLAGAATRVSDGGVGRAHVGLDLDVALSLAQVPVEAEVLAEVLGLPLGHAVPTPSVEGAVHDPHLAGVLVVVDDRPGVGHGAGAAVEAQKASFRRSMEGQEELGVEEVRLDVLGERADGRLDRPRPDARDQELARRKGPAVEPRQHEAEVRGQRHAQLVLEGGDVGGPGGRVDGEPLLVPVGLDPANEI